MHVRENIYYHEQTVGSNANLKGIAREGLGGNDLNVSRNWRKAKLNGGLQLFEKQIL